MNLCVFITYTYQIMAILLSLDLWMYCTYQAR